MSTDEDLSDPVTHLRPADTHQPRPSWRWTLVLAALCSALLGAVVGAVHWWSQRQVGPAMHAGIMTFLSALAVILTALGLAGTHHR